MHGAKCGTALKEQERKKTASFRDCAWNQLQLKLPASDFVAREGKSQDIIRYDGSPSSAKCPWIRIPWFAKRPILDLDLQALTFRRRCIYCIHADALKLIIG